MRGGDGSPPKPLRSLVQDSPLLGRSKHRETRAQLASLQGNCTPLGLSCTNTYLRTRAKQGAPGALLAQASQKATPAQVDWLARSQPHRRLAAARLLPADDRLDTRSDSRRQLYLLGCGLPSATGIYMLTLPTTLKTSTTRLNSILECSVFRSTFWLSVSV